MARIEAKVKSTKYRINWSYQGECVLGIRLGFGAQKLLVKSHVRKNFEKMKNKVLVVGTNAYNCKNLVESKSFVSFYLPIFYILGTVMKPLNWTIEDGFYKGSPFLLETKYYTTTIEFWVHDTAGGPYEELGSVVDSVIFTFDPKQV